MRVLVTGGNGFIGRHIVKELVSRGIEVESFDIIAPKEHLNGVEYTIGTVLDTFSLSECLKRCDAVFHLAAILGVKRADRHLLKCMTVNIQGTINILEAIVMNKVKYVLLASSSEIFGDLNTEQIHENSPRNPKSGYAVSKLAAEKYLEGFSREYGLDYNIIRFFNIYGPGQVAEFVIPRFIKMVQNGVPPKIYGDGKQVRSFCHIYDAARGVVDIFLNERLRNRAFNVGNDLEPITINELAEKIILKSGCNINPELVAFSESDRNSGREIYYRVPDISRIRKLTDYEPKVLLDEGIQNVIDSGDIPESWIEPIISNR